MPQLRELSAQLRASAYSVFEQKRQSVQMQAPRTRFLHTQDERSHALFRIAGLVITGVRNQEFSAHFAAARSSSPRNAVIELARITGSSDARLTR